MSCEHLQALEQALIDAGIRETFRGQAWTNNCREWVYFDCRLDRSKRRQRFHFQACVADHEHLGTHDGQEAGFICTIHHDGIMGLHPRFAGGSSRVFTG